VLNILRNITYDLNEETVIKIKIDVCYLIKILASDDQKNNIYLINALQETGNYIDNGIDNYLKKFIQAFNRKNVAKNVARIFWKHSSQYLKENSSDEEVIKYLNKELETLFSITEHIISFRLDKLSNIISVSLDKTNATISISVFDYNCFDNILNYLTTPGKLNVKSNNQGLNYFFKDVNSHILAFHLKNDYNQGKLFFVTEFDKVGQSYISHFSTDEIKDQVYPLYLDNTNIGQFTFSNIEKDGIITHLNFYEANIAKAKINVGLIPGLFGYPKITIKNENDTKSLKSPLIKEPLVLLEAKIMREQILKIDSLINKQPNNSESYFIRGLLKADLTMFESAKLDFVTAIKLNPNKKEYAYYLGVTFFNLMQYQDSKKILTSAMALDSKYLDAIYLRGISCILIGEKKEGCVDLDNFKTLSGKKQLRNNFCN
jgi:tetratricopeptide (TPR) repeat protein